MATPVDSNSIEHECDELFDVENDLPNGVAQSVEDNSPDCNCSVFKTCSV